MNMVYTSVNTHISPIDYSLHYITVDNVISIFQELYKSRVLRVNVG